MVLNIMFVDVQAPHCPKVVGLLSPAYGSTAAHNRRETEGGWGCMGRHGHPPQMNGPQREAHTLKYKRKEGKARLIHTTTCWQGARALYSARRAYVCSPPAVLLPFCLFAVPVW